VIAYFVIQTAWSPWVKFAVVVSATLAICVLLYEFVLRRFAPLRLVFGIKTHVPRGRPADAAEKLATT
jgi:glucan biosynthesis protein C